MPLSSHSWAREAAEGAACAQMQSSEAFWHFHDELFRRQRSITKENVKATLKEIEGSAATLNAKTFDECVETQMSLGLVFQDADLASSHQVAATPTLFINGQRVEGIRDEADLRRLIKDAVRLKHESKTITE